MPLLDPRQPARGSQDTTGLPATVADVDSPTAAREIGTVVAHTRGVLSAPAKVDGLTIAIGTSPGGLSLADETRLSKAASLYADHVILYSPTAVMLANAEALGHLNNDGMLAFLRAVVPLVDGGDTALRACDEYDRLRRKRRRSRGEI